jgi:thiol-disulfide isomerase/thioredoxin
MGIIRRLGRRAAARIRSREETASVTPRPASRSAPRPTPVVEAPIESLGCALASVETIRATVFDAGKPRLINHWATWCEGCVEELPLLVSLHQEYGDSVEFIGVSWDGFQGGGGTALVREVDQFSRAHGLPWESLVVDADPESLFESLEMACHTVPQVWLVDAKGVVVHRVEEVLDDASVASLKQAIASLPPGVPNS